MVKIPLHTLIQKLTTKTPNVAFEYSVEYGPYLKQFSVNTSESFYQYLQKKIAPYISKKTVALDVGCGLGRVAIDIANTGTHQVIGIDTNGVFLYEAAGIAANQRQNILSYPCHGSCDFRIGDVHRLSFEKDTFSLVTCVNVLDRIEHPQKAVDQMYRVLQPQGILILSDPYDWQKDTPIHSRVENMKQLLDKKLWQIIDEEDNIPFHLYINPRRTTSYRNHLVIAKKRL